MIPGEVITAGGNIELNAGLSRTTLTVSNTGDRPIQVGSHYHFAEANTALGVRPRCGARQAARHCGRDGGALRTGSREVVLVPYRGRRIVQGFQGAVMGALD